MDALNVLLIVGAVLLALFTFIFSAGSLIHLSSLINEAVRVTTGLMPRWMKTAVVVLGVVAVGLVAIGVSDHRTLSLHALAAPGAQVVEATAGTAANVADGLPAAEDRLSRYPGETTSMPASAPRECSLERGIVTECTFN